MNIQQIFGAHVRRFREMNGWSQDKLSEVSGLHRTYISGIERGVRNPTIEIVYKISIALHIPMGQLFDDHDDC